MTNILEIIKPKRKYVYWKPSKYQKLTDDLTPYQRRKFKKILLRREMLRIARFERRKKRGEDFLKQNVKAIFSSSVYFLRFCILLFNVDDILDDFLYDYFEERVFLSHCVLSNLDLDLELDLYDIPSNLNTFRLAEIQSLNFNFNIFNQNYFLIIRVPVYLYYNCYFWLSYFSLFWLGIDISFVISSVYNEYTSFYAFFSPKARAILTRKFRNWPPHTKSYLNVNLHNHFCVTLYFNKYLMVYADLTYYKFNKQIISKVYNKKTRNYITKPHLKSVLANRIIKRWFRKKTKTLCRTLERRLLGFPSKNLYIANFATFFTDDYFSFLSNFFLNYKRFRRKNGTRRFKYIRGIFRIFFAVFLFVKNPRKLQAPRHKVPTYTLNQHYQNIYNSDLLDKYYENGDLEFSFFFKIYTIVFNNLPVLESFFLNSFVKPFIFKKDLKFYDVLSKNSSYVLYGNFHYNLQFKSEYLYDFIIYLRKLLTESYVNSRNIYYWAAVIKYLRVKYNNAMQGLFNSKIVDWAFEETLYHRFETLNEFFPFKITQSFFWRFFNFDISMHNFNYRIDLFGVFDRVIIDTIFIHRYTILTIYSNFIYSKPKLKTFKEPKWFDEEFNESVPSWLKKVNKQQRKLWFKKFFFYRKKFNKNVLKSKINYIKQWNLNKRFLLKKIKVFSNLKHFREMDLIGNEANTFSVSAITDHLFYCFVYSSKINVKFLENAFRYDFYFIWLKMSFLSIRNKVFFKLSSSYVIDCNNKYFPDN